MGLTGQHTGSNEGSITTVLFPVSCRIGWGGGLNGGSGLWPWATTQSLCRGKHPIKISIDIQLWVGRRVHLINEFNRYWPRAPTGLCTPPSSLPAVLLLPLSPIPVLLVRRYHVPFPPSPVILATFKYSTRAVYKNITAVSLVFFLCALLCDSRSFTHIVCYLHYFLSASRLWAHNS